MPKASNFQITSALRPFGGLRDLGLRGVKLSASLCSLFTSANSVHRSVLRSIFTHARFFSKERCTFVEMSFFRHILLFILVVLGTVQAFGQTSTLRKKSISTGSETIQLDSLSIYPNSFKLFCNDVLLGTDSYELNYSKSSLRILKQCEGQLTAEYRVLPMNLSKVYGARDTS